MLLPFSLASLRTALVPVAALGAVVVALMPLVNGATAALVAPSNAIGCVVAVGLVTIVELAGFSTLSITCMMPLETMISVVMTWAELTNTLASSAVTVRGAPVRVGKDSLARPEVRRGE
jgi:hypothetical protein